MANRRSSRRVAVQALYSYDLGDYSVDELLRFRWIDQDAGIRKDLNFAQLLVQGTIENLSDVDDLIRGQLDHWDFSRVNKVDLAILRVSVYCLRFQPTIPPSVTIDEAIELSKDLGTDESYRFVNGVLDGIRRKLNIESSDNRGSPPPENPPLPPPESEQ